MAYGVDLSLAYVAGLSVVWNGVLGAVERWGVEGREAAAGEEETGWDGRGGRGGCCTCIVCMSGSGGGWAGGGGVWMELRRCEDVCWLCEAGVLF